MITKVIYLYEKLKIKLRTQLNALYYNNIKQFILFLVIKQVIIKWIIYIYIYCVYWLLLKEDYSYLHQKKKNLRRTIHIILIVCKGRREQNWWGCNCTALSLSLSGSLSGYLLSSLALPLCRVIYKVGSFWRLSLSLSLSLHSYTYLILYFYLTKVKSLYFSICLLAFLWSIFPF